MSKMKLVDLFSGCGGMSLGFQNAGFEIVAAFYKWEPAVRVYKNKFAHPIFMEDLSDEIIQQKIVDYNPEIIIGGPPCQDFSSAGHRNEANGRAVLSIVYSNIITKVKPKYFVMENVPEIIKSESLKAVLNNVKQAGYGLTQRVLDASYCGVPQARKRYFLIGCLDAEDGFLDKYLDRHLASSPMTMYDYFGDSLGIEYYFRVPRSYNRRGVFSIYEPCQTIRGVDRPIPKGYKGHPSDPIEIGPKVRALTIEERAYVQTFPKNFIFEGTKGDKNLMIGNAVPVKLAEFVGNAIIEYDGEKKCE